VKQAVSLFIMDVRGSSRMEDPDDLTAYLEQLIEWMETWTDGVVAAKQKHRLGDEIIFIGEHFFSAYIVASAIKKFWIFDEHPPYFGLTYGYIDRRVEDIQDLDTWNHRLVKYARTAAEKLRKEPMDNWILFEREKGETEPLEQEWLLTGILQSQIELHKVLVSQQTKQQNTVCSLFSVYRKQLDVARALGKTASTISNQMKQGLCDSILSMESTVEDILLALEHMDKANAELLLRQIDAKETKQKLHEAIREHLKISYDLT
jgi:hypothetical protein